MMNTEEIREILSNITYPGLRLEVSSRPGGDMFLQVVCDNDVCNTTGEAVSWKGRKWLLSQYMVLGEVVQTAFLAIKTALEHELRENFKYEGVTVFDPHLDITKLVNLRMSGRLPLKGRDDGLIG